MESGEPILETGQTRKFINDRLSTLIDELAEEISISQEARYRAVCEERDCLLRRLEELDEQRHRSEAALIAVPASTVERQDPQQPGPDGEASAQDAAVLDEAVTLISAIAGEAGESVSTSVLSPFVEDTAQAVPAEAEADGDGGATESTRYFGKAVALKQRNVALTAELEQLRTELNALQLGQSEAAGLRERLAQFEDVERDRDVVRQKLTKARQELAALEEELKREQEKARSHWREIKKLEKSLKSAEKAQDRNAADMVTLNNTLVSVRAELDQANQNLSICQSAREVLRRQKEQLEQSSRHARDEYELEVATRLSPMLASLSALAGLEPNETQGLSARPVFEDFRRLVKQAAGGRLESFPAKSELTGDFLRLDADTVGLESLMERYDWAGERPFEGLPIGQRKRAFRLSRRGWIVNNRVVARAFVTAVPDEQTGPDEASHAAEQE